MPSGPLTSLPFHVLITERPNPVLKGMARYQQAAWLARQQAVTVLPSVSSLQALCKLGRSQATQPYVAFGNPLLADPSALTTERGRSRAATILYKCELRT